MSNLSEILTSAATLVQQAEAAQDQSVKDSMNSAARLLLDSVSVQLVPGAASTPEPQADPDEDD